jgi:type IV secretory pathway VirB10-like protein
MIRRPALLLVVAALAAGFAGSAAAQWKWRDKNGTMHISDMPPPSSVPDKDVLQRPRVQMQSQARSTTSTPAVPAPAASAAPVARSASDPEIEARLRRAEQERQAANKREEEKVAAQRAENCARAKESLRTLDSGTRLVRVNEKGEKEVLDDKMRAEETQRARNVVSSECK